MKQKSYVLPIAFFAIMFGISIIEFPVIVTLIFFAITSFFVFKQIELNRLNKSKESDKSNQ